MAHFYGGQSEYLINEENKNQQTVLCYAIIGFVALTAAIAAVLIYAFVYRAGLLEFSILLWVVDVIVYFFILPKMDRYAKERDNFHKGHTGEGRAWYLLKKLPDSFHVFQGVKEIERLWGDIDFVVVGPTGVYTVEIKSHRGIIRFDGSELTRDWWKFKKKDFLKQAKGQAYAISELIKTKIEKSVWVSPLVVFTSSMTRINIDRKEVLGVHILRGNDLVQFIKSQPIILDDAELKKIVGVFCESGLCVKHKSKPHKNRF